MLETAAGRGVRRSAQQSGTLEYWNEKALGRIDFIAAIIEQLDRKNWPNKSDAGWSDYDLELYGSRWSSLQLTTVAEDHPPGKQMIRCRLRARWSLQAKVAFWLLCALELLAIGFIGGRARGWMWPLLLIPVVAFVWFVRRRERTLQSMMIVFLDKVAKEWKLVKALP